MRMYIFEWVRTLAAYFIFMTMVLNFIPEGQYRKYVRYFFSLFLLLLLSRPLGELTGWEERMSRNLDEMLDGLEYQESLDAGLYVGEEDRQFMERACEERIREQTEELLAGYGLELVECVSCVELAKEPGIRSIRVRAGRADAGASGIQVELPQDFGAGTDQEGREHLQDPAREIRTRIMETYELEESQVTVYIQ
ncbi:MAG: stage III sporulation protein AF [Lachnospiraceae bacterium]|nr:stage III sporulation protein AF [Lachnospiraceae bacterium]